MYHFRLVNLLYPLKSVKTRLSPITGFAIPTALFLGMLAVLIAMTTIVRSQSGQATAKGQQKKLQAGLVADAGLSQLLARFKDRRYQSLLARNYDPIDPVTRKTFLGADGIPFSGDETTTAVDTWGSGAILQPNPCQSATVGDLTNAKQLEEGNDSLGDYQLLAYRFYDPNTSYNPTTGSGADGDEVGYALIGGKRPNVGLGRRWVKLPLIRVNSSRTVPFPGLFIVGNAITLQRQDILRYMPSLPPSPLPAPFPISNNNANIVCAGCDFNASDTTSGSPNCLNGYPTAVALDAAIDRYTGFSVVDGQVVIAPSLRLKPVPSLPAIPCTDISGSNCFFDLGTELNGTEDIFPRPSDLDIINSSLTPWPLNAPIIYKVGQIDIRNGTQVKFYTNNRKIHLYFTNTGNMSSGAELSLMSGAKISNLMDHPDPMEPDTPGYAENFYIYGTPEDISNVRDDQVIDIRDDFPTNQSAIENAIVFAPDAQLQMNNGSFIRGAVWIKGLDGTYSNTTSIFVPDTLPPSINPLNITSLPDSSLSIWQIRPFSAWNQQPVD